MNDRFQGTHQGAGVDVKDTAEKKTEAVAAKETARSIVPVEAQANGMLIGKTLDEEYRIAKALCSSKILPKAYDTPEKVFAARQLCFELGLKPMTGLRQIAVINGTPSMFGDLPLAIVRGSKELESFKEFFIDANGDEISYQNKNLKAAVWGAVCILKRKGFALEDTKVFTLDDARTAKLLPADSSSPWTKYQRRMLQMRTRSWILKDNFSDFLNGVAIAEYDLNELPETHLGPERARDVTPIAQDLNELFEEPAPVKTVEPVATYMETLTEALAIPDVQEVIAQGVAELNKAAGSGPPELAMDVGLYSGYKMNEVKRDLLSSYYIKLRKKNTEAPLEENLAQLLKDLEAYLENTK